MLNRYIIKHKSIVVNSGVVPCPMIKASTNGMDNYNINIDNYKINLPKIHIIKTIFKPFYVEPYLPIETSTR